MSKVNITLAIGDEKLEAIEFYLKKQNTSLQKKLDELVEQLYEKTVPEAVREFLDAKSGAKPKRPAAPQQKEQPKSTAGETQKQRKEGVEHGQS